MERMVARAQAGQSHQQSYTAVFEPADEGGYVVTCPALPGLVTEGGTLAEARDWAKDAVRVYVESLIEDGLSVAESEGFEQRG